ncbi:MAG: DUF3796 domain-containing protein [Clostridiales bacterium]|nr:DUF3796 domain-containing protein [Clostridiales bacterium]MCF8023740.1 DUF3796 domain-containing protein [Clostridiales bacterium]
MCKKGSPLKYLSLFGLLGLLGLITSNPGFYGFFGFFGFFSFANIKNDEFFSRCVAKAGLNAFLVTLVGLALTITYCGITSSLGAALVGVAVIFAVGILVFTGSTMYYERRGISS